MSDKKSKDKEASVFPGASLWSIVTSAIVAPIRRRAVHSIQGSVYDQDWMTVAGRFITGGGEFTDDWVKEIHDKWYKSSIKKGTMKPWKEGDLESGRKPPVRIQERMDMLMLSAGEPQKYGSIKESTFKPTRGAEKGEKFYTFRDTSQTESVYEGLKQHLPEMETGKSYNVGTSYHVKHGESSFLNPGVIGMGKYQISKGEDEMGKYMAIYDKWDIDAGQGEFVDKLSDWALPGFEMYDRRYYEGASPEPLDIRRAPSPELASVQPVPSGQMPVGRSKASIEDKIMNFLHKVI